MKSIEVLSPAMLAYMDTLMFLAPVQMAEAACNPEGVAGSLYDHRKKTYSVELSD